MPINRQRTVNPAKAVPLLGYISKGIELGNAPIDTNRFWVSFNSKLFSPAEIQRLEQQWASYHSLSAMPDNGFLTLWNTLGGKATKPDGKKITETDAKRSILTTGFFPDGSEHNYAPKALDGLTILTDDLHDDISYEAWLEWRVRNQQQELMLLIRCDMETQHLRMNKENWRVERSNVPCQRDTEKSCECKPSIGLRVIYWGFMKTFRLPYGYFMVQSGAWNDDNNILPALGYIQQTYAEPYHIAMSKIPFRLWREPYTYDYTKPDGKTGRRTDHVLKLAATTDFILSLGQDSIVSSKSRQEAERRIEPVSSDSDEQDWQTLASSADADADEIPADSFEDPFDFASAYTDSFDNPYDELDDGFEGGGPEDDEPVTEAGYSIDQWWALCFGATMAESLEYWKQLHPETVFPTEDHTRTATGGMFMLAKALAEAKIRVPINAIYREGKETYGYLGVDKSLRYHIRTVKAFEDAGYSPEHVETLRKEGIHVFDISALDFPAGILEMKVRQSGPNKGTVYFNMTSIELMQ